MVDLSFSEVSVIKLHKLLSCVTLKYKSHSFSLSFVCLFFHLKTWFHHHSQENLSFEKPSWQDRDNQISRDD